MAVAKSKTICNTQNQRSLQKAKLPQAKIALSTQCKAKTKRRQNIAPSTPSVEEPQHCIFDEICQFFVSIAVAKSNLICNTQNRRSLQKAKLPQAKIAKVHHIAQTNLL